MDERSVNKPTTSSKASAGKSEAGDTHSMETLLVWYHVCMQLLKLVHLMYIYTHTTSQCRATPTSVRCSVCMS